MALPVFDVQEFVRRIARGSLTSAFSLLPSFAIASTLIASFLVAARVFTTADTWPVLDPLGWSNDWIHNDIANFILYAFDMGTLFGILSFFINLIRSVIEFIVYWYASFLTFRYGWVALGLARLAVKDWLS